MTNEWNRQPGPAVVNVLKILDCDFVDVEGHHYRVPIGCFSNLPAPDADRALRDAVVETGLAAHNAAYTSETHRAHHEALAALQAAQHPPRKYAGLRESLNRMRASSGSEYGGAVGAVYAELAKLEAEERPKGPANTPPGL